MGAHIQEEQVVLCATSNKLVAALNKFLTERLSICLDLFAVLLELRSCNLFHLCSYSSHLMIMRAALQLREHSEIDLIIETALLASEYHSCTGSPQ